MHSQIAKVTVHRNGPGEFIVGVFDLCHNLWLGGLHGGPDVGYESVSDVGEDAVSGERLWAYHGALCGRADNTVAGCALHGFGHVCGGSHADPVERVSGCARVDARTHDVSFEGYLETYGALEAVVEGREEACVAAGSCTVCDEGFGSLDNFFGFFDGFSVLFECLFHVSFASLLGGVVGDDFFSVGGGQSLEVEVEVSDCGERVLHGGLRVGRRLANAVGELLCGGFDVVESELCLKGKVVVGGSGTRCSCGWLFFASLLLFCNLLSCLGNGFGWLQGHISLVLLFKCGGFALFAFFLGG